MLRGSGRRRRPPACVRGRSNSQRERHAPVLAVAEDVPTGMRTCMRMQRIHLLVRCATVAAVIHGVQGFGIGYINAGTTAAMSTAGCPPRGTGCSGHCCPFKNGVCCGHGNFNSSRLHHGTFNSSRMHATCCPELTTCTTDGVSTCTSVCDTVIS